MGVGRCGLNKMIPLPIEAMGIQILIFWFLVLVLVGMIKRIFVKWLKPGQIMGFGVVEISI